MKNINVMVILILLLIAVGGALSGCTDATMGKLTNFGGSAHVKCWSGGVVIYDGRSSGKVLSEANSDGYYFKEDGTGDLKEVSGNCVITYD